MHNDLPATNTNKARNQWNAHYIMKILQKNNPYSFPQSLTRTKTDNGWHLEANSKPNALTFSEFKVLYSKCGEILHRGSVNTIEVDKPITLSDYKEVTNWSDKIVELLNEHLITRTNGNGFYLISLKAEPNGSPSCSVFSGSSKEAVNIATYNLNI